MFKRRIRKDAGEISIEDLRSHPSWEFCFDEEGIEGQDECTMRPFKGVRSKLRASDDCSVACTFQAANGRSFLGWIELGSRQLSSIWHLNPELFVESIPEQFAEDPLINSIPTIVTKTSSRCGVCLALPNPKRFSTSKMRPIMNLAYKILAIEPDELFPLSIVPNQSITEWPEPVSIEGFINQPGRASEAFIR